MAVLHVGKNTSTLKRDDGGSVGLLWGDACRTVAGAAPPDHTRVRARGQEGVVKTADLQGESLLEIYVIDVGQGDGVLVKTPEGKWHLVDAGVRNSLQMTRKGAVNFIRWKFLEDLGAARVEIENAVVTHADADHYGGMVHVLEGRIPAGGGYDAREFDVVVKNFWHNGMGRFKGAAPLGATEDHEIEMPDGSKHKGPFIVRLLEDAPSWGAAAGEFTTDFAKLGALVASVPERVGRLDGSMQHLPGYGPGGDCVIRVLGPIAERLPGGRRGLRWFGSRSGGESVTRNGHSVVLRLDYGSVRVLLTGDLNSDSQRLLLQYGDPAEFESDVVKGCHHGSDDVDLGFLRAMGGRVTVISSGDNESYQHPRPRILGASAYYGRTSRDASRPGVEVPPLVYSTELARSMSVEFVESVKHEGATLDTSKVLVSTEGGGGRLRRLSRLPLVTDLIYGLVNVRTDGRKIVTATMSESGGKFDTYAIRP